MAGKSYMALSVLAQLNGTKYNLKMNNMIPFKISNNDKKKCYSCKNIIKKEEGYIQFDYRYQYFVDRKQEKHRISKIMGLFRDDKGNYESKQIQQKIRYKYYCSECLYWLFQNHLKDGYDEWLSKKVADKI